MTDKPKGSEPWSAIFSRVAARIVGRGMEIKAILAAMAAGKHLLLEGPPGTSKSTLLRAIAQETGTDLFMVEGNIDLTPAKLVGHFNPAKVVAEGYSPDHFEPGPLTRAMECGGLLYLEEFNRMPADVANVLISPMEEGEMSVPRYGRVKAVGSFTVIAAQNPYDDVGTVRVSRAFMDRICRIEMDYQSESEERRILSLRTGVRTKAVLDAAIALVRATRKDPDIKLGASIRGAIDLVDLFMAMERVESGIGPNFLAAAQMAMANKIWLTEMTEKTADVLIREIIGRLNLIEDLTGDEPAVSAGPPVPSNPLHASISDLPEEPKKKVVL